MVRHYIRKRFFHTRDRVLIHLSSESLRPEEQTQEGVAAAVKSGRSTLTKWLDRMEREGLVSRERVRLSSHPLPKYAYRLTEEGWQRAGLLRRNLASRVVTVRTPNLEPLAVRVSDVPSLASHRIDLTTAVSSVRKGHLEIARDQVRPARDAASRVWGRGLRRVDRFFGRREEFAALDAWYGSDSRALFLTGLPGIGKSALVAAWVQGRPRRVPVYGFEIHPSTTGAELLADFAAFLAWQGRPSLATHLAQGVPLDPGFVLRLLERELAGLPLVVVLDNADQASRDVARMIRNLSREPLSRAPIRRIYVSRSFTPMLRNLKAAVPSSRLLRIHGLDPAASRALLRHRGLGSDERLVRSLTRTSRGHPLLLHLVATSGAAHASAVRTYLEEEVWGALSPAEKNLLEAASVLRKAARRPVLEAMAGAEPRVLTWLCERNLLERTVAGGYVMHDLVREFVDGRIDDARRKELHALAARPLLRASQPRERWEGVYHLLKAGRAREAASFLDSDGAPLLDCVAAEEILSLLRGFALDESEPETYCIFTEILGDSLKVQGHLAPALHQFSHARKFAEASRRPERVPRLLRKMAFIERCRNHYPRALGYLVEAHARLVDLKKPVEMTEVLREMALVEQALGELDKASNHLSEAIDLATDASDWGSLSRALLALSSLETSRGNREGGADYAFEGLRIAGRSGSLAQLAHAHIVVGTALAELKRLKEALGHFETGLELARATGNLRLTGYGTLNRTAMLLDLGRYDIAAGSIKEAQGYFDILEERDTLALLQVYEGQLEMGLGHWNRAVRAWREGLAGLREFGGPTDLGRALKEVGGFCLDHGAVEEGRSYLSEAEQVARKLGNATLVSEIEMRLRALRPPVEIRGRV